MHDRSFNYLTFSGPGKAADVVQFYRDLGWTIDWEPGTRVWLANHDQHGQLTIDDEAADEGQTDMELFVCIKDNTMQAPTGQPVKALPLMPGFVETDGSS